MVDVDRIEQLQACPFKPIPASADVEACGAGGYVHVNMPAIIRERQLKLRTVLNGSVPGRAVACGEDGLGVCKNVSMNRLRGSNRLR